MDQEQLVQVMLEEAKDLKKAKKLPEETEVIASYTGRRKSKHSEGKEVYKQAILATLGANGNKEEARKLWPSDWINLTFRQLAAHILPLLVFLLAFVGSQAQLNVSVGAGKTELKNSAILIGVSYLKSFDSIWASRNNFVQGKHSFTSFYPEVDIKTGTADAFSSINLKVRGLTMTYKNKRIATVTRAGVSQDITAPDLSRTFHTFPFGLGVESNNRFDNINGIAEVGWAPWFQKVQELDNVEFMVSVQAGYKFSKRLDSLVGGEIPKTLEKEKNGILRIHSELGGSIDTLFKGFIKAGIEGNGSYWYDVVNGATYYQVVGNLKVYVSPNTTIQIGFQKGSAAPLFNDAFQYQVGASFKL